MDTTHGILADLAEAQESYRLANLRICELIGAKIVLTKQRDEMGASLDKAKRSLENLAEFVLAGSYKSEALEILRELADPFAILAAREKTLRDALAFYAERPHYPLALEGIRNFKVVLDGGEKARTALADAPEAKP